MTYQIQSIVTVSSDIITRYVESTTINLPLADGTQALPSYTFGTDLGLGLYCKAAGEVCAVSNNKELLSMTETGVGTISYTSTERDALTGMREGDQIWNSTSKRPNWYTGTAWFEPA